MPYLQSLLKFYNGLLKHKSRQQTIYIFSELKNEITKKICSQPEKHERKFSKRFGFNDRSSPFKFLNKLYSILIYCVINLNTRLLVKMKKKRRQYKVKHMKMWTTTKTAAKKTRFFKNLFRS